MPKLQKPARSAPAQASMQINPPPVKVRIPEIKVPEIKVPEIRIPEIRIPDINVPAADMRPVADAIKAIGGAIMELGDAQRTLAEQQAELLAAIKTLAGNKQSRARSYTVDFDRDNGETVGMRIKTG